MMGHPDPAPDGVGPSQLPLNFVDGNGYIVLRGLVEARDCEVGWNKVMKASGIGDKKLSQNILSCFSTPGGVKIRQGIRLSRGVGRAKAPWVGGRGSSPQEVPTPPSPKVSLRLGTSTG